MAPRCSQFTSSASSTVWGERPPRQGNTQREDDSKCGGCGGERRQLPSLWSWHRPVASCSLSTAELLNTRPLALHLKRGIKIITNSRVILQKMTQMTIFEPGAWHTVSYQCWQSSMMMTAVMEESTAEINRETLKSAGIDFCPHSAASM